MPALALHRACQLPSSARGARAGSSPSTLTAVRRSSPEAPTLLTQSTNIQNTRSGFSLATVHKMPNTAIFPASQGFELHPSGSKQSGAGRSGAQLQNTGMPAGSLQQSTKARGVSKCFGFFPAMLTNLQGSYARTSRSMQQPARPSSSQCLPQAEGTHCPQSCYLLPLTAACFFYPSRSNTLLPKPTLQNIKTSLKLPNAQKMTAEGSACLFQPFLCLLSATPWFPSQTGSESSDTCSKRTAT